MSRIESSRLLTVVLLLVIADNIAMFRVALGPVLGIQSSALAVILAWQWFLLIFATIAVLVWRPRRAVFLLVVLALFSTIALSIPLVPFVMELVPVNLRPYALVALNTSLPALSFILLRRGDEKESRSDGFARR
jgi:hypothetical protein